MEKEIKKDASPAVATQGVAAAESESQPTGQAERPNRDAYAKMFLEDYPDVDFEDKEARYGKMIEDRKRFRDLSNSGRELTKALDKNRWLGAMFQDLAANPDKDPISWMYDNGIDVQKAMEDEEYRKQVAKGLATYQKKQSEGEAAEEERTQNLGVSADALSELGLSDEENDKLWSFLFENIVEPGLRGEVSKDVWTMIQHAMNYDTDIANAREEAGMQARNEKFRNQMKTFDEEQVPPTFSQGQGRAVSRTKPKKESLRDFVLRNR